MSKLVAEALYESLHATAAALVKEGQEHMPLMFVQRSKEPSAIVPLVGADKDKIAMAHRAAVNLPDIVCAVLVMESWMIKMAKVKNEEQAEKDPIIMALQQGTLKVSDLPDRTEAIIFNFRTPEGQWLAICEIDRTKKTLTKGELIDTSGKEDGKGATGRFIGTGVDPKKYN